MANPGNGFMTIDGENHEMFGLKKFQSDAEFQESDFKVVGTDLGTEENNRGFPKWVHDDLLWESVFFKAPAGVFKDREAAIFYYPDNQ